MLVVSSKSNLGCEAGCGLRFHGRIILGSFSDHSRIILGPDVKWSFCVAGAVFGEFGG